jgi:hypothetical protein
MSVVQFAQYVLGGGIALALAAFFIGAAIISGVRFGEHVSDRVSEWYCIRQAKDSIDEGYAQLCDKKETD